MMTSCLCVTVRFLQPFSHGCGDGGKPEWPPSPLRMFQALVAAAAAARNERIRLESAVPALQWLERQPPPIILAALAKPSDVAYRMYVPNNAADLVAAAWSRGNTTSSIAEHRTEKDVRPTHLVGDAVHYLYPLGAEDCCHLETLRIAARALTHLGWGIDLVAGNAEVIAANEAAHLSGERWSPANAETGTGLRRPIAGTLSSLINKHQAFLNRLSDDGFKPVPPLTTFEVTHYRRDFDVTPRPLAAFQLLQPDGSKMRPFDTTHRGPCLAGMLRHITGAAAHDACWSEERISRVVFGHAASAEVPDANDTTRDHPQPASDIVGPDRFAYLPLPSLEGRGPGKGLVVGSIRRVLITTFGNESAASGETVFEKSPEHPAAKEIRKLVKEIVGLVP